MVNNVMKVVSSESIDGVVKCKRSPFLFFPFNDYDIMSTYLAWEEATAAGLRQTEFRIAVLRRPPLTGPWQNAELIGENQTRGE